MFRLRHNLFQGFPVRVSVGVCRALLLPLPSSNRTCGFPASGSRCSSRSVVYQAVARAAQKLYAQPFETGVVAFALRFLAASLAASVEVLDQSFVDRLVLSAIRDTRVAEAVVAAPALCLAVDFADHFRQRFVVLSPLRQFVNPLNLFLDRFGRGKHVQVFSFAFEQAPVVPEGVAQKVNFRSALVEVDDPSFLALDFQAQPAFDFLLDEFDQPFALL